MKLPNIPTKETRMNVDITSRVIFLIDGGYMYLKRIELQGFKSFPDKLALDFDNVLAVIVGPNGSGKSNIADAVRWVLGEQSVKSLRGQKWEDVIFSGTQNRRPLNFAEVSMTIDNKDRKLDSDYTDVTVTRKVFRSGESEYLINGKNCRLKDIRELFMDTGVGKEGYSIIGQGRIDEILNARSDERRQIFEEASGIVKYKTRRQEAFTKLENENKNLVRVNDIISEIELNIEPLKEQSVIARQFLDLSEKLKLYEINLFIIEEQRLKSEIQKLEEIYDDNSMLIMEKGEQQTEKSEYIRELKSEAEKLALEANALREDIYENKSSQEKYQNNIKLNDADVLHFHKDIERLNLEIEELNEKSEKNSGSITLLESKLNRERLVLSNNEEMLSDIMAEYEKLNAHLSVSEIEIEKSKNDVIENIRKSSEIKGELLHLKSTHDQTVETQTKIAETIASTNAALIQKQESMQALQNEMNINSQNYQELLDRKKSLLESKNKVTDKKLGLQSEFDKVTKEIIKSRERMKVLTVMAQEHEGFFRSVKEILNAASIKLLSGIKGVAGEVLTVKKEYEIAIEIAMGASMQNIITADENSAKRAIDYLKRNNYGRATFLPLNTVKPASKIPESVLGKKGIIGTAKSLVSYDEVFEPIMSNLLERVVITENMNAAIEFSKKTGYKYKVVTLGGELISAQGAMTGGSLNEKRVNIFSRNREITEISVKLKELYKNRDELEAHISSADSSISKIKSELDEVYLQTDEARLTVNTLEQRLAAESAEMRSIKEQITANESEAEQAERQLQELARAIRENMLLLEKIEIEGRYIEERITERQTENQSDKELRDKIISESANLRITVAEIKSGITAVTADIDRLTHDNAEIADSINRCSEEISEIQLKISEAENRTAEVIKEIENLRQECLTLEKEIVEKETARLSNEEETERINTELQDIGELISELTGENIRIEAKKERFSEDLQRIFNDMWEDYEITLKEARKYEMVNESPSKMQRAVKELKNEIKALGNVNVSAIEQYKETKERYEFLTNQRIDIIEAEKKLQGIIEELTALMEKTFNEQFALISENFDLVFREMFGGGRASLEMSDKDNPLESGIEIVAEMPGKKLQSISLLSGGEKALTAIALLFGILRLKPSPFCILDEIEAALDDANIIRFASYLKKLRETMQFIVITHRKGTMESANVMYGVTMEEQGVSKLISINFEEAVS